jgi:GT2 family glycosyltransferase
MSSPKISIIILNWNGIKDTLECLESVYKIDYQNFDVVVVDNGSRDDEGARIKEAFPRVTLIANEKNLGFAEGNNVAIRHLLKTDTEYVLLLNNDTAVDPLILREFLSAAMTCPDAGIYGAKIYFYAKPDRIWHLGGRWNMTEGGFQDIGMGEIDDGVRYSRMEEIDYVNGCALLFSRHVPESIGLLDADFFAYYEEIDWCFRAKRHGFRPLFVPKAKVWHKVSLSSGGAGSPLYYYYMSRNCLLWAKKHFRGLQRMRAYYLLFCHIFLPSASSTDAEDRKFPLIKRFYWDLLKIRGTALRIKIIGICDFFIGKLGECGMRF